jgi:hypothetical protein
MLIPGGFFQPGLEQDLSLNSGSGESALLAARSGSPESDWSLHFQEDSAIERGSGIRNINSSKKAAVLERPHLVLESYVSCTPAATETELPLPVQGSGGAEIAA